MAEHAHANHDERDPFAPIESSPRFATPLAIIALVLAAASVVTSLAPITGPVGMAVGLVAHVKGSRLGVPAAILAGIGMIAGFSIMMFLR